MALLGFVLFGMASCRPIGASTPTRVESGLLFSAGNPEFDHFFAEYFNVQSALAKAPDDERAIRQSQAQKLGIVEGATPALLIDTIARSAEKLTEKKVLLRLEIEGLDAEDEADTMVQAAVSGKLDEAARTMVENATLLARLELRHAAHLRKLKKRLTRLSAQEQALEPSLEPTFEEKGYSKLDEVRRNLLASRRTIPLLTLRADDQAEGATQFVRKLQLALTTDKAADTELLGKADAPLITSGEPTATKRTRGAASSGAQRKQAVAAPAKPKPLPAAEPAAGDFEP